ncbi:hypothetical protein Q5P01_023524 [Channa striata]|uniref:BHLH domain-containing protein n=1 Tax=Channa striata TaxID=64152 RepID=A0AA88LNX3_CHASR|nr:hypothetical protein Q5P01_023524 [Channa striata]
MTADKEKRRAISREAARRRRRVESDVFGDLSRLLPLQPSVRAHVDKPSIIRLTLSYIRMQTLLQGNVGTKVEANHTVKYGQVAAGGGDSKRMTGDVTMRRKNQRNSNPWRRRTFTCGSWRGF